MAAVIRPRRIPPLTLQLPIPASSAAVDVGVRFTLLPLPPPPPSSAAACEYRISDFEKLRVLGHGSGGTVHKVRNRRTGKIFALKVIHGTESSRREAEILRRIDSPFVIRCHASFAGDSALLLDFADAGSLGDLLSRGVPIVEPALAEIGRQALLGLGHLHSRRIAHRDIKPANLLVSAAGEIKIADFGAGKIVEQEERSLERRPSYVGTCAYMSPERFDPDSYGGKYDAFAADVWSLGLTLLELHLGHFPLLPPGQRPDWAALVWAVCFGDTPELPETASAEFRGFIGCCLQRDSDERWSVEELLGHPFLVDRDPAESERAFKELLASTSEAES